MKKILKNALQFLLFLSIGAVILYLVYRQQNAAYLADCALRNIPTEQCDLLGKLANDFRNAHFGWIALVALVFLLSNVSRTLKWHMLLHPLGFRPRFINGFLSILVGYFANLGLPRMGEVVRAGVFSKYEHIPAEKVMGTIVVDRIVDIICLLVTFGLALIFESEKLWGYLTGGNLKAVKDAAESGDTGSSVEWKWIVLGVLGILATGAYLLRKRLVKTVFFQKVFKVLAGFWEGILTVKRLEKPWLFAFHSLSIFFCYFLMTWLGFQAFQPTQPLGLTAALTVFAFGTLGMVIPSPGGMGTFHFLVITSLTIFYGIRGDDAFSVANIIFFSVSIGFNILLGLASLILLPVLNRKKHNSQGAEVI